MSENLRSFTKAIYAMDAVVQRVPVDRWDAASPCDGWTARDVVAHQVGVLNGAAQTIRTGDMARTDAPTDRSEPVAMWNAARDGVLEALDHPGRLQQSGRYWFGDMTIDQFIGMVTWDPLTHAWDVAQATGQPAHLPEDVAQQMFDTIEPIRDRLAKRELISPAPVEVGADADVVSRYLALVGRDPQ